MKPLQCSFLLTVLFLISACTAPVSQNIRPDQLVFAPLEFEVPKIEQVKLANGIRVYLLEDPELPLVEITAMIGAGSIAEPAEKDGQGDLFAALLEDGGAGERGPRAFEEYLESLAIDFNADTGSYVTTIDLSLLQEDLHKGLQVLDDVLRRPRFDADRLELHRKQTLETLRRRDDVPGSVASRALNRAIYGDHPLGRSVTAASVSAVTRQDLVAFHQQHFVPNKLWLAISGDFDRQVMLTKLEKTFGDWQPAAQQPQPLPELQGSLPPAVWVAEKDIPQTTIRMGELGVSKDNPDLYALRVMNFILGGGGFNSRMLREIRSNRGLAYSVYSYFSLGRKLPGIFIAGSETKSASTMQVVHLMLDEIMRIRTELVSEEELALAKESQINSFVFAFTGSHQILTQQVRLDYFDYPADYMESYRQKIAAVTRKDILRVAQTYLQPEKLAIVLVGQTSEFEADLTSLGLPVRKIELQLPEAGTKE